MDTLLCQVGVCCQLQPEWLTTFKEFKIRFQLIHGNHRLSTATTKTVSPSKSFFHRLSFEEWIPFDWPIFSLPREVKLELTLIGIKNTVNQSDGNPSPPANMSTNSSGSLEPTQELGVGSMYLFDFNQILADGQYLIPLWINSSEFCIESDAKLINSLCFERGNPLVHISFPETDFEIKFPPTIWDQTSDSAVKLQRNINSLDSATQTELFQLLNRNPLEPMSCGDREQLWDRRYYLYDCAEALPKVLLASHTWESTAFPLGVTPMTPLSHSLSAPSFSANAFSNTTYSYSYSPVFQSMTSNATTNVATTEDIKRLVTNGNQKNSSTIVSSRESKANNSDLIDLVDNEGQDILEMFDPLSRQENNDLNFSNNFELDSESSAQETNKPEAESLTKTETNEIKAEEQPKEFSSNSNDIHKPFRVVSRKGRANEELDNFFKQLVVLRRQYRHDDYIANSGLVISPTLDAQHDKSLSVKLVIETQLSPQPVSFTCNVD
ncbi:unnamed protein product, partial [Medioppia subpectinata]